MFDAVAKLWTGIVALLPRAQRRWWRLWRRGYFIYVIACGLLAASANCSFRAGLTTHRRAEEARLALFSEHEPYRGDLYPGIAAAFTSSISVAALAPPGGTIDRDQWSVSCSLPATIEQVENAARTFQSELAMTSLAQLRGHRPSPTAGTTYVHLPDGVKRQSGVDTVQAVLSRPAYKTDTRPPFFGDRRIDGRHHAAPIVAFHVTTVEGALVLRPPPPTARASSTPGISSTSIPKIRKFNNTSYFMNTLDGVDATGRLICGASDHPLLTETRPYIDLGGMGFVATVCRPLATWPQPMVFCADVRLPLQAVIAGLKHQGFADTAIVDVAIGDDGGAGEEASRVTSAGSLELTHGDLDAIARNTTLRLLSDGTFKPGGGRRKQLYGIVLGRRQVDGHETLQLLVFRPRMLSAKVGLDLVGAAAFLVAAAVVLVYAMRKVAARADEDARRSLQIGLVKTAIEARGNRRTTFAGGVAAQIERDVRALIAAAPACAAQRLTQAKVETFAQDVLAQAMHSLRTNFNAFERIEDANAIAQTLLGEPLVGALVGVLGSDTVLERVSPGAPELRCSTYADVQARRANGRSSEYFQCQPDGTWLRFVGAPIREPDGSFQTVALIERVDRDLARRLDAIYVFATMEAQDA